MRFGIRTKLFFATVTLVLGVGVASGIYLENQVQRTTHLNSQAELHRYGNVVKGLLESASTPLAELHAENDISELFSEIIQPLAGILNARITVTGSDGAIVAASKNNTIAVDHECSPRAEAEANHGVHIAIPFSYRKQTTQSETHTGLICIDADDGGNFSGIVHSSVPLLPAAFLGLLIAVLMSALASHFLSRTLRTLADSARAIAFGDADARIDVQSSDEIGKLAGSVNRMADDIERTVAALATERARFKAVLEGMNEAVLALDQDFRISLCNTAAQHLLGIEHISLGTPLVELIRTPDIHELFAHGDTNSSCEFELPSSPPKRVLARITHSHNEGLICVLHDVTSIRQLETVRRDFVANVSHELRTPVSIIRANAETLLDGAMSDPIHGQRLLEALHRNAERLSRLVADLLDLSRLEASSYRMDPIALTVHTAVQRAVGAIERTAQAKRTSLEVDIDPDLNVYADEKALDQILVNYLDNAIKYTPPGGHISLLAHSVNEQVSIHVIDNGPGIAPQNRTRIFERFYRVDPGRSRDMGGTGLGLSIVKHLADALGGEAGMTPVDPQGSDFWITLPLAKADALTRESEKTPQLPQ